MPFLSGKEKSLRIRDTNAPAQIHRYASYLTGQNRGNCVFPCQILGRDTGFTTLFNLLEAFDVLIPGAGMPVALVVLAVLGSSTMTGTTPSAAPPVCDQSLWNHVYVPERLKVVNPCMSVTGVIESVEAEPDGDYHIRVKLDQQYSNITNVSNKIFQHGDLVVEAICAHETSESDARAACAGFHQDLKIPPVGTHVKVIGSYVLDRAHFDWAEIHPVTSITPIDGNTMHNDVILYAAKRF